MTSAADLYLGRAASTTTEAMAPPSRIGIVSQVRKGLFCALFNNFHVIILHSYRNG